MATTPTQTIRRWAPLDEVIWSGPASTQRAAVAVARAAGADLRGAALRGADLREVDLREADLREADLRGAHLHEADLSEADLREADLRGAHLREADLREADLREADLRGAALSGAILTGADLREVDLTGAILTGANLTGANLTGAILTGANLTGANLTGANLTGAAPLDVVRADLWAVLDTAPAEAPAVAQALRAGRINGSVYEGPCACLIGTIARARGCRYDALPGLAPNSARPAERWFVAIEPGQTPETSEIVRITVAWVDQWIGARTGGRGAEAMDDSDREVR